MGSGWTLRMDTAYRASLAGIRFAGRRFHFVLIGVGPFRTAYMYQNACTLPVGFSFLLVAFASLFLFSSSQCWFWISQLGPGVFARTQCCTNTNCRDPMLVVYLGFFFLNVCSWNPAFLCCHAVFPRGFAFLALEVCP